MLTEADDDTVAALTGLINEVYATSEAGLWTDGAARTTSDEIAEFVRAGQIAVAFLDGHISGCVHLRLGEETSKFGMLATSPHYQGRGVGRALISYAERSAQSRTMRLELLVPREGPHPFKERLAAWYTRIGYRRVGAGAVEALHPHLAPLLAAPCDVAIYEKDLRAAPIEDLTSRLRAFVAARDWQRFHTPKNLAMALAGEAGELLAELQWLTPEESAQVMDDPEAGARVRAELADVTLYLIRLADALGIDPIDAANTKLDESERRYDADTYRGSARKAPPLS